MKKHRAIGGEGLLYGPQIGKRISRKRFVKLLMRKGIRRNDANDLATTARGTGLSYAEYLWQNEQSKYVGTSSLDYPYARLNFDFDRSIFNYKADFGKFWREHSDDSYNNRVSETLTSSIVEKENTV